jgi:hypothetical protein
MQIPTWTKPGITGAIVGAIATMILGFSQGGWYTGGSAERLAQQKADVAVIDALIPVCISQSKLDPEAIAKPGSEPHQDILRARLRHQCSWASCPRQTKPGSP